MRSCRGGRASTKKRSDARSLALGLTARFRSATEAWIGVSQSTWRNIAVEHRPSSFRPTWATLAYGVLGPSSRMLRPRLTSRLPRPTTIKLWLKPGSATISGRIPPRHPSPDSRGLAPTRHLLNSESIAKAVPSLGEKGAPTMPRSTLRSSFVEQARYTGLTPAAFGACFMTSTGMPRSSDWARRLIDRGLLAAMDTNPGGKQRRFMIPMTEVERFRNASMVNPNLLSED